MNDDSFVVYFELLTKSMFHNDRISMKSKLDVT
jgi:hypothetical protein